MIALTSDKSSSKVETVKPVAPAALHAQIVAAHRGALAWHIAPPADWRTVRVAAERELAEMG